MYFPGAHLPEGVFIHAMNYLNCPKPTVSFGETQNHWNRTRGFRAFHGTFTCPERIWQKGFVTFTWWDCLICPKPTVSLGVTQIHCNRTRGFRAFHGTFTCPERIWQKGFVTFTWWDCLICPKPTVSLGVTQIHWNRTIGGSGRFTGHLLARSAFARSDLYNLLGGIISTARSQLCHWEWQKTIGIELGGSGRPNGHVLARSAFV